MFSPVCICPGRPRDTLPGGTHRCPLPSAEMCFLGGSEEKSCPSWTAAARSLRRRFSFGSPDPQGGVSQSRTSKSRRARGMHRSECPRENREDTGETALEGNISEGHKALGTRDQPTAKRPSSLCPLLGSTCRAWATAGTPLSSKYPAKGPIVGDGVKAGCTASRTHWKA